jgi:hypothetical protein
MRDRGHPPKGWRLNIAWPWSIVGERLVGTRGVVVGNVGAEEPAQMGVLENDDLIPALAADGADHPFHEGVLPGRALAGHTCMVGRPTRGGLTTVSVIRK